MEQPGAAPVVAATPDEPAPEAPATATTPRRRRSSRRAVAAAGTPEAPVGGEATGTAPALDVLAELAGTVAEAGAGAADATSAEVVSGPAQAAGPAAALLFQEPSVVTRPRRRRVQVATGAPEEISAATHHGEPTDAQARPGVAVAPGEPARTAAGPDEDEDQDQDQDQEGTHQEPAAQAPDEESQTGARRRRRRGGRGRRGRSGGDLEESAPTAPGADEEPADADAEDHEEADGGAEPEAPSDAAGAAPSSSRRRRRRRSGRSGGSGADGEPRTARDLGDEVTALRGSTRLEAKRQRRREGRDVGRRRQILTEAEFLARRESVERSMVVRERTGRTQIAVLEDGVLVEHFVTRDAQVSMAGNVYLGRVQNVLPSMEAAFVDIGKGRNAVLYAGEVNWDAAGLEGQPRRIEQALKAGDPVMVQVTKDPIGHKGARLTSQITLAGRYLVFVPGGGMTGISRKLPDAERSRLKKILRDVVPDDAGVIVRTAAEGATEAELRADIERLQGQWDAIEKKSRTASAPALLQGEPDLAIRVVRDIFNDDFSSLVVQGDQAWAEVSGYLADLAPDLADRVTRWTSDRDVFAEHRIDEQLAKGMDRKVWLPSGGSLVIDRTEAMTVIDVNTGKYTGAGGTLEETVTRNNLEAAEEIVRQLRLRDIGGMIVVDFIDMVLESNRDLVLRRLVECLGRDRTKHQVAEVTSLGLVQMTRKRVGQGLVEAFSETCEHCNGRGFIVHTDPVERRADANDEESATAARGGTSGRRKSAAKQSAHAAAVPVLPEARDAVRATLATIAAAAAHAHEQGDDAAGGAPAEVAPPAEELLGAALDAVADAVAGAVREAPEPAAGDRPEVDQPGRV